MAELIKRIDNVMAELTEMRGHAVKFVNNAQSPSPDARHLSGIFTKKINKDMLKIRSVIRGFHLEMKLVEKQITAADKGKTSRVVHDRGRGDVESEEMSHNKSGKKRLYQAKAVTTPDHSAVNKHIKKASQQLFGMHGEVPGSNAKLIGHIVVHSGKNTWPFTPAQIEKSVPNAAKFKKAVEDAVTSQVASALTAAFAFWNGKGTLPAFQQKLQSCDLKIVVEFKKQFEAKDPKTRAKQIANRTTQSAVKKVTVPIVVNNNNVQANGTKVG